MAAGKISCWARTIMVLSAWVMTTYTMTAYAHQTIARDDLVVRWNEQLLQAVRDVGPPPTVVSRMLAITHTCMYDAWAAYDARASGTVFGDRLRRPKREHTPEHRRAAISHAAFRAAVDLLPAQRAQFEEFMHQLGFDPSGHGDGAARVGRTACSAVLERRYSDGSNQLGKLYAGAYSDWTGYQPANAPDALVAPDRWQPLLVPTASGALIAQKFTTPQWGRVRPFAIDVHRISVASPAPLGNKRFLEQAREVVSYSRSLTDVQKCISEYWSDGPNSETPPGHWNLFAQFVSVRDRHSLEQDVKLFFSLNNAMMDAGILAWSVKRRFDYVRPISSVRQIFAGMILDTWPGPDGVSTKIRGEEWLPYQLATFITPPFPEYVSGHSTFSAAAAEVLKRFTGSDVFGYTATIGAGRSRIQPHRVPAADVQLSWATFTDAADEAGLSRRFGGIHFREGDMEGRRLGRIVADQVWKHAERYFQLPGRPGKHD